MQGKKGCYWGFGTTNNVVAWIAALGFVVAGAALLATGINTVNGCSEKYKACRAANGPLSDVDTDKCVPVLAVCAKPGIGQYTAGAVLLACVALPAFYFCCCAVRPDKQQVHPSGATVSPGAVGDKKQSIDCEKQGVSQQVSRGEGCARLAAALDQTNVMQRVDNSASNTAKRSNVLLRPAVACGNLPAPSVFSRVAGSGAWFEEP